MLYTDECFARCSNMECESFSVVCSTLVKPWGTLEVLPVEFILEVVLLTVEFIDAVLLEEATHGAQEPLRFLVPLCGV